MMVLQVITDTDHRGAQVSATELEGGLRDLGLEVATVALAPGRADMPLPVPVLGTRRLGWHTLRMLRRRAQAADVVIAHGSTTLPACAVALAGSSTPFVYRQISDSLVWASTPARRLRVRAGLSRAAGVVALGDRQARVLTSHFGVPRDRIRVVPNAASGMRFTPVGSAGRRAARDALGLPAAGSVVLSVSALVTEKRVDRLLRAVATMADPNVRVVIVGDGPCRSDLRALADELLPDQVSFTGSVADIATAYAAADVLVLASETESMPTTLIEAALCGLPVIATDVGGVRDIVVDGETGLVVPPNDEAALARALAALLADPARSAELGAAAERRARECFTVAAVAPRWESVLAAVHRGRG